MFTHPKVSRRQGRHSRRAAHDEVARRCQVDLLRVSTANMRKCPRLLQIAIQYRMIEALVEEYQFSGEISGFGMRYKRALLATCFTRLCKDRDPQWTFARSVDWNFEGWRILGVCRPLETSSTFLLQHCSGVRRRVKLFQRGGDGKRSAWTLALQPPFAPCSPSPVCKDM